MATLATASKIYDINGNLIDNPNLNNPNPTITADSLEPVSGLPYVNPNTSFITPVAGLDTATNQATPLPQEQQQSDTIKRTQDLYNQLFSSVSGEGITQTQNEQKFGITPEVIRTQTDLGNKLKSLQNEALAIPQQLQLSSEGRGITTGGLQPLQTAALRTNAIQALGISSLLEASKNNIATAQMLADKATKAIFDPIKNQIDANLKNLDLLSKDPTLTLAQQNRINAQNQIQEKKKKTADQQEENHKTAQAMAAAALKNNPSNSAASLAAQQAMALDPTSKDYLSKVFDLIGKYQSDPNATAKSLLELDKLRADIAKTKGDIYAKQDTNKQQGKLLATGNTAPSLISAYSGARNAAIAAADDLEMEKTGKHFNAAKAEIQYQAAKRFAQSLNSSQMVRFSGLANSVVNTISEVDALAQEMNNRGIPLVNRAKLLAYIQATGANSEKGQLAARYLGAVNTLKEEFANLANGGYAPTEAAWELANKQINEDFDVKKLQASLFEVQRLINYRIVGFSNLQPILPGQTGGVLRSPDGKDEVNLSDLTPAERQEAQDAGWR